MRARTPTSETLGQFIDGRFIPRMAGGEDDPPAGDPPQGHDDPPAGKDGKPFDADRAQRTIDQLREEIKALKSTSKEAETLRAKLKEIEDAEKSEAQRAADKAAETEQKLTAAEQRAADLALQIRVERAAGRLGFHDPDDAYRLIDRRAVEMDDDGEPKNVDDLLKALAKAKPHLVKAEDDTRTATRSVPSTPKPTGKPTSRDELVRQKIEALKASGSYSRM